MLLIYYYYYYINNNKYIVHILLIRSNIRLSFNTSSQNIVHLGDYISCEEDLKT